MSSLDERPSLPRREVIVRHEIAGPWAVILIIWVSLTGWASIKYLLS